VFLGRLSAKPVGGLVKYDADDQPWAERQRFYAAQLRTIKLDWPNR